jgi:uncharacterized protein involved in type VI secretion and phage assembly
MSAPVLGRGQFAVADWWRAGVHIGIVTSVEDPESVGRVQVKLPAIDPAGEAKIWARVAVPYAGDNFGAFFIPDVDSEVLVAFVAGDAGWPVVIGSFWNGATGMPEDLPGDVVDRWTLTGKNGTRIAIVEESEGQEKVEIELPSGAVTATLTDANGGEITLKAAGNTVKLSTSGVSIKTSGAFNVDAGTMLLKASALTVDVPSATFTNATTSSTNTTSSTVSASYTPGAGSVW